jgi:hypothetical protein
MLTVEQAQKTNSIQAICECCKGVVWVVPRNLVLKEEKGAKLVCIDCGTALMLAVAEQKEPINVVPAAPYAQQVWDERWKKLQ